MSGDLKSFEKNRDKLGLSPLVRKGVKTEDRMLGRINNAEDVKSILFWLFDKERKNSDISDVFAFSTSHAVLMVTNVRHRGYATIEDVREIIEPLVRNELKADKIREKFEKAIAGGAKTAEEIASKTGGQVVPLEGVKLGSNFIPQLFTEPRILGAAFGVKEKSWSKAIAGNNVVAVIYIESRDKVEIPKTGIDNGPDFANNPQFLANRLQETVRAAAELQDYRYKFPWD
jgi:peptidyl-prolyl cis-trans isomerase D